MFSIAHTEVAVKCCLKEIKQWAIIQICECHGHTQLQVIDMLNR